MACKAFSRCFFVLVLTLQLLSLCEVARAEPTGTQCSAPPDKPETCVCKTDDGIIDLTTLSNDDGETARFTGITDENSWVYSYNPCMAFYNDLCYDNVYSCQEGSDGSTGYNIAEDGTEEMWIDTDGTVYLYYTGDQDRETKVYLHCDTSQTEPLVTASGDSEVELTYVFDITGCDVCPGGCDGGGGGGGGEKHSIAGAAGIVVMSLLIIGIITYFVAGALIMKLHYKATGTDIIPNKKLWFALPIFIKDGCLFTFSPCANLIRGKMQEKKGYEDIPP